MGTAFSPDGAVYKWMSRFANLVFLNVLWIICCIPVITAGAATTAMYAVLLKMARDEESYVVKNFFHAFTVNFKQATVIWLMVLAYAGVLLAEVVFCIHFPNQNIKWFVLPVTLFAFIGLLTVTYVFPVLSFFDDSVKNTIKNAFLMAVGYLPNTFIIILVNCMPLFIVWFFSGFLVLATFVDLMVGFSFCAWLNARRIRKIFEKNLPDKKENYVIAG